jgi:hypothetical protein
MVDRRNMLFLTHDDVAKHRPVPTKVDGAVHDETMKKKKR